MRSFRRLPILGAVVVLLFSSLACNFFSGGASETPAEAIPVSTEAVQELEQNVESAAATAANEGRVSLVVEEAQVTSLVAFELKNQTDPKITEPQVYLRDGRVQFLGNLEQNDLSLPLKVELTVTANAQGKPEYEIVSANVGPLPLPDGVLSQFQEQMDSILASSFSTDEIFIENITIADGKMTITGYKL